MYTIRKEITGQTTPEKKGELVNTYPSYAEAAKHCKDGYYISSE